MTFSTCWLCNTEADLCESHIIPKLVFRWLIQSGGTPYLRSGRTPNRRDQDGDKYHLYCKACESLLSNWETKAKAEVFEPATRGEDISGKYGPWLARFSSSLALRVLHSQEFRKIDEKYSHDIVDQVDAAKDTLKRFLLGSIRNPGRFKQYIYYPGYFDSFDAENLPRNWNTWVKRSVEYDLIYTESGEFVATYAKLGPLIFFGKILDDINALTGKHIRCGEGFLDRDFANYSSSIWNLIRSRAHAGAEIMSSVSERQRHKTDGEIDKNFDRFAESDLAKELIKDYKQFGPKAKS